MCISIRLKINCRVSFKNTKLCFRKLLEAAAAAASFSSLILTQIGLHKFIINIWNIFAPSQSAAPGLVSNNSCNNLTIMKLLPPEQQPHTVHISTFCCYMQKFAQKFADLRPLSDRLMKSAQIMQSLERRLSNQTSSKNCSLLTSDVSPNPHNDVMCFLQHVEKILSNFWCRVIVVYFLTVICHIYI